MACDAPATSSSPAASPRWWEAALAEQLKVTSAKVDSALRAVAAPVGGARIVVTLNAAVAS